MDGRRNRVMLGIILLAIGAVAVFNPLRFFGFLNIPALLACCAGGALVLMYRFKRKGWSLALGAYLASFGALGVLRPLLGGTYWAIIGAAFFVVPAAVFFVLYFDKNKRGVLVPASALFWFGIFIFLSNVDLLDRANSFGCLLLSGAAAAFTTRFFTIKRGEGDGKKSFTTAVLLSLAGCAFLLPSGFLGGASNLVPALFIIAGVIVVVGAFRKKD